MVFSLNTIQDKRQNGF